MKNFKERLGMRESTNNYQADNGRGYIGKYQFGRMALIDTGYMDKKGNWTGKDGISSQEDFLNSPDVQEKAMDDYIKIQKRYLKAKGADKYIGKKFGDTVVTEEGLLAAAHLIGAGGVTKALRTGKDKADGFGTKASEYMKMFSDSGRGPSSVEEPEAEPMISDEDFEATPMDERMSPLEMEPMSREDQLAKLLDMQSQMSREPETQVFEEGGISERDPYDDKIAGLIEEYEQSKEVYKNELSDARVRDAWMKVAEGLNTFAARQDAAMTARAGAFNAPIMQKLDTDSASRVKAPKLDETLRIAQLYKSLKGDPNADLERQYLQAKIGKAKKDTLNTDKIEANGRVLLVNMDTGETIKDLGEVTSRNKPSRKIINEGDKQLLIDEDGNILKEYGAAPKSSQARDRIVETDMLVDGKLQRVMYNQDTDKVTRILGPAKSKEKDLSFEEKQEIKEKSTKRVQKERIKEQEQVTKRKENRELKREAETALSSLESQIKNVKSAIDDLIKIKKEGAFGLGVVDTGPLDQYVVPASKKGRALRRKLNKIALKEMTTMFQGMSRAIDSDTERAFFESTQPNLGDFSSNNLETLRELLKNMESLKNKTNAKIKELSGESSSKETTGDSAVEEVPRVTKDGRRAIFNANTKEFIRYED